MLNFDEVWQCLSSILTQISFLNFDFEVEMSE